MVLDIFTKEMGKTSANFCGFFIKTIIMKSTSKDFELKKATISAKNWGARHCFAPPKRKSG